jgi:hypothetical protein
MLSWIRAKGPMHSFDDYRAALNLMLGLENGFAATVTSPSVSQTAFTIAGPGGPLPPGAKLKPGTTKKISGEVSRQKLNELREYLYC